MGRQLASTAECGQGAPKPELYRAERRYQGVRPALGFWVEAFGERGLSLDGDLVAGRMVDIGSPVPFLQHQDMTV